MPLAFPKPGKVQKPAVKVFADGREVCNMLTKAGRDEYERRKTLMWQRQGYRCCLEGYIEGCAGKLARKDAAFDLRAD